MLRHGSVLFVALCAVAWCQAATFTTRTAVDQDVQHRNVERTIDLTGQNVKIAHKLTVVHAKKAAIGEYVFVLPKDQHAALAYISFRDAAKKELKFTESPVTATSDLVEFTVQVPAAKATASPLIIHAEVVLTRTLRAHPAEIAQNEKQLVRYFGSAYFVTPYETAKQRTVVLLSSKNVESYTPLKPVSLSESQLTYGPYENVRPLTDAPIHVHYENHSPFLTVTRLERTIEVSHWGNIAVEETIDILHTGALLKGPFSRYDFQKDGRHSQASVKQYKTVLPASASSVYYRDTNGNISTSAMRVQKDSVELDLRPRFPLFGGWRTHYTLGYSVPSYEYLYTAGDQFLLKMRLIDHIFDDQHIDEATVRIILPEGCQQLRLHTPYAVQRANDSLHYTYLDTFGRTVVEFRKSNLVEQHIADFNLKYQFARVFMVQEPLLLIGFLYVLFVLVIVSMRLDFSITKEPQVQHHHRD